VVGAEGQCLGLLLLSTARRTLLAEMKRYSDWQASRIAPINIRQTDSSTGSPPPPLLPSLVLPLLKLQFV